MAEECFTPTHLLPVKIKGIFKLYTWMHPIKFEFFLVVGHKIYKHEMNWNLNEIMCTDIRIRQVLYVQYMQFLTVSSAHALLNNDRASRWPILALSKSGGALFTSTHVSIYLIAQRSNGFLELDNQTCSNVALESGQSRLRLWIHYKHVHQNHCYWCGQMLAYNGY